MLQITFFSNSYTGINGFCFTCSLVDFLCDFLVWAGFDHTIAGLLVQIGKNRNVRRLRIGRNVNTVKAK